MPQDATTADPRAVPTADQILEPSPMAQMRKRIFGHYGIVIGGWSMYTAYGIERLGALANIKKLGPFDWYAKGSSTLLRTQQKNGGWRSGKASETAQFKGTQSTNVPWRATALCRESRKTIPSMPEERRRSNAKAMEAGRSPAKSGPPAHDLRAAPLPRRRDDVGIAGP